MAESTLDVGTNSYQELTDADAYFAEQLDSATWDAATDANKEKALITAYRAIETLNRWAGVPYDATQSTKWPRRYVYDDNGNELPYGAGDDADHYPAALKAAQCEEALARLRALNNTAAVYADFDRRNGIVERQTSEGARVKYGEATNTQLLGALVSSRATELLRPLLGTSFTGVQFSQAGGADLRYIGGRYRGEGDGL